MIKPNKYTIIIIIIIKKEKEKTNKQNE